MVRVSLRDFLTTGRFGPVHIAATREVVEGAFGPPDDRDARAPTDETATIWKYGDIEFHFDGDGRHASLRLIHADYFSVPQGGPKIDLDPWLISGTLRQDVAEVELTKAGVAYTSRQYDYDSEVDELRTSVGVSLLFSGEQGAGPRDRILVAMSLSSHWR
jgi:hypothetical protein